MKKIFTIAASCCCLLTAYAQPGALDNTFAVNGKFLVPDNQYPVNIGQANATVIDADGKIIMVGTGADYSGSSGNDFFVTRLNTDGTIDNSFGVNGKVLIDFSTQDFSSGDFGYQLTLQPDGKIVVVGYSNDYYYNSTTNTYNYFDIAVARLNADGSLDNSFDGDGKKLIDLSALTGNINNYNQSNDYGYGVAITADNKIAIMGDTYVSDGVNSPNYDAFVLQLNSDGSFNTDFDGDGIKIVTHVDSDEFVFGFTTQADGKFLIGGITGEFSNYQADILVIRFNTNGTPDDSFDGDGRVAIDFGGTNDFASTVITQSDGKILVNGGQTDAFNSFFKFVVVRLNTDGSLDNSFDGDGVQTYGQPDDYNGPNLGLALQADGKIIQAGSVTNNGNNSNYKGGQNFMVIRYNTDGSVDSSFGNYGTSTIDFGNWTDGFYDVGANCAVQPDGKIIAVGFSSGFVNNSYYYNGAAAARLLVTGNSVSISAPPDQNVQAPDGECGVAVNDIDPILDPTGSTANVNYELHGATEEAGAGTLSGAV